MKMHIEDYPAYVRIGCMADERMAGMNVLVSLDIEMSKHVSSVSENLESSLDYVALFQTIDSAVVGKEIPLVENVVAKVGQALLDRFVEINTLWVTVTKPKLPAGKGRGVGVSIQDKFCRG